MAANESCKDNPVLKRYGLDTSDRLLCVGEGDFGWSRSLSDLGFEFIVASDILEIDSEHRKQNIQALKEAGHIVLIPVDLTNASHVAELVKNHDIHIVFWNCPHVCHENSNDVEEYNLVEKFFVSIPTQCHIKMILTRKQFAKWVAPCAVNAGWVVNREFIRTPNLSPLADLIDEDRKKQDKNFENHLKRIAIKVHMHKFSSYRPQTFDLIPLKAKNYWLIDLIHPS